MGKITDILHEHIVERAIIGSAEHNDYAVSHWASVLDGERRAQVLDDIAATLGHTGYVGMIYVEQNDLGNGQQDIMTPRVHIETRGGRKTKSDFTRKMASSTIAILRQFPENLQ